MTLLPDSPYIVLSAGEDGQVPIFKKSSRQKLKSSSRCCQLISGSPSLTRYYFWGMKKTKRFAPTHSHLRCCSKKFPPGANLQYPLLPHKFSPVLHLRQVAFLCPSVHHNLWNLPHRDQFIRVFDRRYLGLEARGGGQVFLHESDNLFQVSLVAYIKLFSLQVYRHCPTDLRDSDSFKAYITCAVFSGDGQEVKISSSLSALLLLYIV